MVRTPEEVKQEAVARMKALKIHDNAVREFKNGKLNESEHMGALYWLNEAEQELVKNFEENGGDKTVYHVIHSFSNIGEVYNILFVNHDDEEWEYDRDDLSKGQVLAYVYNKTFPDCSEFGTIGVRPMFGGVIRNW